MKTMVRLRLIAALLLATALPAVAQSEELRGVALVIGESDYTDLTDLANPERDARAMDELLSDLGFEVTRVLDGDAERLRDRIADFVDDAAHADVALVYYSGHGVELGGQNYLVPVDTDLSSPQTAGAALVPVDALLAELAKTVPVTILLLDACRTNAFPPGQVIELPGDEPVLVAGTGLEAVRGPTPVARAGVPAESLGVVIGFAASPGQPALDGAPGGNSPYAAALIKHLRAGGYEFGDLMTMVSEEVYLETDARQLPWTNSSLRRLLTFGEAPEEVGADEALIRDGRRALLLTVAATPPSARALVEVAAAEEGVPLEALYGMLKVLGLDPSDGQSLEVQLRQGAEQLKTIIAQRPVVARTDEELIRLSDLALEAENEGAIDVALKFREQAAARADELAADVDRDEDLLRQNRLEIAATYVEYANTASLNFDFAGAAARYRDAFEQVERWDPALAVSYLQWQADALYYQGYYAGDLAPLRASVAAYEEALALAAADDRETWGTLQNNLGLAYTALGDWGGDVADMERAETAFQNALTVWSKTDDPAEWALAQGNVAGVLAKLGQRFVDVERLRRSADAYAAVLEVTDRADANTYAQAETNYATSVLLLATETGDHAGLEGAIAAFRHALTVFDVASQPSEWTIAQNGLGSSLKLIGDKQKDAATLAEAVAAFRAVIEAPGTDRATIDWGATQNNLGNTLVSLGRVTREATYFEQALDANRSALTAISRDVAPLNWANVQNSIGTAWFELSTVTGNPELKREAAAAYRLSMEERTRERAPLLWAETMQNLGNALRDVGTMGEDIDALHEAADAYRAVLEVYTQDIDASEWAVTIGGLGWTLVGIGRIEMNVDVVDEGTDAIRQSLTVWTEAFAPDDRGVGLVNLSIAQGVRGILSADPAPMREALRTLMEAEALYARLGYDDGGGTAGLRMQFESFLPALEEMETAE